MAVEAPAQSAVVVEDDAAVRLAVNVILHRHGFQVVSVAESGREALRVVRDLRPDAVVVDLALAGESGVRVVPALLAAVPGCAVVVLSPFNGVRQPALDAGASGFVELRDLRQLDWCLRRLNEAAHVGCDCCPPRASGTTIAFDPRTSWTTGSITSGDRWGRYSGPHSEGRSRTWSTGSRRRKPPSS